MNSAEFDRDIANRSAEAANTLKGLQAPPAVPNDAETAQARKDALMGDQAWVQKYVNGDIQARTEMTALNQIIAAGKFPRIS